jgi:photosystem II biogenesis protein Psp29
VDELMVEMHLLAVNVDFRYDPIYALGVVTAFHRFMQGYRPEQDIVSIFDALCRALQDDPQRYTQDAARLENLVRRLSLQEVIDWLQQANHQDDVKDMQEQVRSLASNASFKYSRLFAIGLFTLIELADAELAKDETHRNGVLKQVCTILNLPEEKVQKDLDLYRSNLEKMAQARIVMEDLMQAEKKKREEREQAKNAISPASADGSRDQAASG